MRSGFRFGPLLVTVAVAGCSKGPEQVVRTPSAQAVAPATTLETAPQSYKRMRFVSDIEQSGSRRIANAPRHLHSNMPASVQTPAPDRFAALAAAPLTARATPAAESAPATIGIVSVAIAEPAHSVEASAGEYLDHSGGGDGFSGMGAHVVIRGGRGENQKCDPRTDAKAAGMLDGRPNSSMPLMPSRSVFGGSRR